MGYIFVGSRSTELYDFVNENGYDDVGGGDGEDGILKTTLKWHFEGEDEITTVEDSEFPYEFFIPVTDRSKKIMFNVETQYKTETKTLDKEYTIAPQEIELQESVKYTFEPVSLSIINALGSVGSPLTTGRSKYCISYSNIGKIPVDVTVPDALVGCYLSGYLKVKDLTSTTDIVEKGYVLFDNVPIVNSMINTSKSNRFDFSVYDIPLASSNIATREFVDGVYVGEKQGMVNCTNGALPTYDWSNLYITNAGSKNGLQITKDGNTYVISNDGASSCFIAVATFSDNDAIESVKNIPNCAAAPKRKSLGFERRGVKSIIAPIPINNKSGKSSFSIPALKRTVIGPCSPIAPERGRFTRIVPKPMGSRSDGSISFAMAR